ncbi:adenosine amp deaminase [Ophiostoma piceae UAMH 11346]|uniref:adenosine deaminase n=1 Tax=Ophiostoma piceae (strain UAMH 11346) TaxID=1262450 RepID=S3BV32_OPHP1|nr:adenosine amp deaminase [Ophiostoma piceae UAMH 11346]
MFFFKNKNSSAASGTRTDFSLSTTTSSPSDSKDSKDSKTSFSSISSSFKRISRRRTNSSSFSSKSPTSPSTMPSISTGSPTDPPTELPPKLPPPSAYTTKWSTADENTSPALKSAIEKYATDRAKVQSEEAALAFDDPIRQIASPAEKLANDVLLRLKEQDQELVFKKAETHRGYGNQMHEPFAGDHFLTNVELIKKTEVLKAAQHMPKGAHLHIHFNACLAPSVLLDIARRMDCILIMSTRPLVTVAGEHPLENFYLCEIQFEIKCVENMTKPTGNLLSADYIPGHRMPFREFLDAFPADTVGKPAMDWLVSKLTFDEKETYDIHQTANGAWSRFNGRTRMMKGLFNYQTAYIEYTKQFLQSLLDDNIQYAEIRPNFMATNQLWKDDGTEKLANEDIVGIIVNICDTFKSENPTKNFDGIKIIYCTPRSFDRDMVRFALRECIEFKQRWPDYIAGFDLVGEESNGKPLHMFMPELLEFQQACDELRISIPFLFHCGETLDKGTAVDGNLFDALLLKSKRIGHGFALPNHPHVMQEMKKNKVCVEVCPISNEILGLTPRIGGHAVYNLLANSVPCTVASDNGTLFRSTLSHDFYQVLVGKADMGLYGWRRLAEWSLEHSCLEPEQLQAARAHWLNDWRDYVVWLLKTYDADRIETQKVLAQIADNKTLAANEFLL